MGGESTLPFNEKGWTLRYLIWAVGRQGTPSFAPGSVVLHTDLIPDSEPLFRMVWMEPVV